MPAVEVLRSGPGQPHRTNHNCQLPEHSKYEVGTVIRCVPCGRRYELKRVPSQRASGGGYQPGGIMWVRRYWPWPRGR